MFVTEADGDDGNREVVGFSALSVFYDRAGYDGVTDLAYYIAPGWRGRGVGTFTLSSLLDEARQRHMRKACGIIFADSSEHYAEGAAAAAHALQEQMAAHLDKLKH